MSDFKALLTWFNSKYDFLLWAGPSLLYDQSHEDIINQLRSPNYNSLILKSTMESNCQHPCAFGQFQLVRTQLHLARLAVNPEYRNKGLLKVLIRSLYLEAKQMNKIEEITLFVFRSNTIAFKAYQGLGFKRRSAPKSFVLPEDCEFLVLDNLFDKDWLSVNVSG